MSQYTLPLPNHPLFLRDNFIVSDCNREAFERIAGADGRLLLWGPAGSGKSHLGHLWAAQRGASVHSAADALPAPDAAQGALLLEDIDRSTDERGLLHLFNHCKEQQYPLLLTSSLAPSALPFTLPDLTSRLRAMDCAAIDAPDDDALAAVLRKQFADRQLKVEEEVIVYLLPRMERSFSAIRQLVERLDHEALAQCKAVTIPFAKQFL